ncbi:SMC family ATPase [Ralstonia phage RP13]|nr:SMC family ATPase [Ralstonia phage RP13]
MARILTTSDIHIHDYPDHNLFGDKSFRLNQFIGLAHRLLEIAEEKKCDYMVLGGDIIHRPIIPPKTAHAVSKFFDILGTKFDKDHLLFILGQHDLNTKSNDQALEDTIIHVLGKHATYMDGKIINIDGKSIAFSNWRPAQDWSFIKEPVDIMFGHLTLSTLFGQEYDDTKYKLGIFGDIHTPTTIGNSHSINVPIPHYIGDCQDGSVVVVDTDTISFERVLTESASYKHLKIKYEDLVTESNEYTISVKRPTTVVSVDAVHRSIDLDTVIAEVVKATDCQDIHARLSTFVDRAGVEATDLNFVIEEIEIKNFRSIKDFTFRPGTGITAITGPNGAGKSSFMKAFDFLFRPPRSFKNLVSKWSDEMSVRMKISYGGNIHDITRGISGGGYLEYLINGEPVAAVSQSEKHTALITNLPFVKFMDVMYRRQGAPTVLSDYNYSGRIELVNSLLGLMLIDRYFTVGKKEVDRIQKLITALTTTITKQEGVVEANNDDFTQLDTLDAKRIELDNILDAKKNVSTALETLSKIDTISALIESTTRARDACVFDPILVATDVAEMQSNIAEGEKIVTGLLTAANQSRTNKTVLYTKRATMTAEIEKLRNSKGNVKTTCPSCKRALDSNDFQSVLDHIDEEITKIEQQISSLNNETDWQNLDSIIAEADKNYAEANDMLAFMKSQLASIDKEKKTKAQYDFQDGLLNKHKEDLAQHQGKVLTPRNELQEAITALNQGEIQLRSDITRLEMLGQKKIKYEAAVADLEAKNQERTVLAGELVDAQKYAQLFHPTGSVIKSVYLEVAKLLSDSNITVRTVKTLASGEDRIDFDIDFKVGDYLVAYDDLSGGQQVRVDMYFLTRLFKMSGRVGVLIFDETLRDLDPNALENVARVLQEAPVNTVLLSTHVESFAYYSNKLGVELVNNQSQFHYEGVA